MSCFYTNIYHRRFAVPLIAVERFYELQEDSLEDALFAALTECCGIPAPNEEDVAYLLERLTQLSKKDDQPKPENKGSAKKTIGTRYHAFISKLPTDRTLLWMCGFNYARAANLYCDVDRDDVMQMVEDFLSVNLEENNSVFEACLYGNGGSYKDDESGGDEAGTVDLSKQGPKEMKAALAGMFGK